MAHFYFTSKKADLEQFQTEFLRHEQGGYLGNPLGEDAYGYLRVSSDRQTEDWKTGIPRQVESLHKAALRDQLRISWDNIYGDDESGFLIDRPALNQLMKVTQPGKNTVKAIVFESISRMSREWEWQQGWLLWQFEDLRQIRVSFFDEAGSPLERMFKGYAAGEGMKKQIKDMADGKRLKALKGFPGNGPKIALGYRKVVKRGYDADKITKYPDYEPIWDGDPNSSNRVLQYGPAKVVVEIFEMLAYEGLTSHQVTNRLQETYGPPPGKAKFWNTETIISMVRNHVYYGMYTHGRWEQKVINELQEDGTIKRKRMKRERPQSEWTMVPVQPIVTKELWDAANAALDRNKAMCGRNQKKHQYLLTGLVKCWDCGLSMVATAARRYSTQLWYYACRAKCNGRRDKTKFAHKNCQNDKFVHGHLVESAVWDVVRKLIFQPQVLLDYIDAQLENDGNQQTQSQVDYIKGLIQKRQKSDALDRQMVEEGYMELSEYGPKHKENTAQIKRWEEKIAELEALLVTKEDVELQKRRIIVLSEQAKKFEDAGGEPPYEVKKRLVGMCVKVVYVDTIKQRLRIIGDIGDFTQYLNAEEKKVDTPDMGGGNDSLLKHGLDHPESNRHADKKSFELLYDLAETRITAFAFLSKQAKAPHVQSGYLPLAAD